MQEHFHSSKSISKERFKQIIGKKNHPAVSRFVIMYALFIAMNIIVVTTWNKSLLIVIPLQCLYALLCCSLFASLHETVHGTAFKSKSLNRVASLLSGFGHIYPPSLFRALHFTHHRYTHIPGKDPEISLGNRPIPGILSNFGTYLSWVTGLPILIFKIIMLIGGVLRMPTFLRNVLFPFVHPKNKNRIFIECLVYSILYGLMIYYAITYDSRFIAILMGQVIGHCLLAFYLSMEHNGLPHEGNILEKTRSINTNRIVKIIMWNMPYHAEHHAYPAVPFHALPQLHQELSHELKHQDEGPLSFHKRNVGKFLSPNKR